MLLQCFLLPSFLDLVGVVGSDLRHRLLLLSLYFSFLDVSVDLV